MRLPSFPCSNNGFPALLMLSQSTVLSILLVNPVHISLFVQSGIATMFVRVSSALKCFFSGCDNPHSHHLLFEWTTVSRFVFSPWLCTRITFIVGIAPTRMTLSFPPPSPLPPSCPSIHTQITGIGQSPVTTVDAVTHIYLPARRHPSHPALIPFHDRILNSPTKNNRYPNPSHSICVDRPSCSSYSPSSPVTGTHNKECATFGPIYLVLFMSSFFFCL